MFLVVGVLRLASKFWRRAWMEVILTRSAERWSLPLGALILASNLVSLLAVCDEGVHCSHRESEFTRQNVSTTTEKSSSGPSSMEVTKQA